MIATKLWDGWNYKDLEKLRRKKEWKALIDWARQKQGEVYSDFMHANPDAKGRIETLQAQAIVWDQLINFFEIEPDKSLEVSDDDEE